MLTFGDFVRGKEQFAQKLSVIGRGVRDGGDVSLRNDQDMHRRLRMNVGKRKDVLILIEPGDWNDAASDFAEEAIGGCSHVRMLNLCGYFLKYFGSIPGIQGL